MVNFLGALVSFWRYLARHISGVITIGLSMLLAGLIVCYVLINQAGDIVRVDVAMRHDNFIVRDLHINMDFKSFYDRRQKDEISIHTFSEENIPDSLFVNNEGNNGYDYHIQYKPDSHRGYDTRYGTYDLRELQKKDRDSIVQFQNKFSVHYSTNKKHITYNHYTYEFEQLDQKIRRSFSNYGRLVLKNFRRYSYDKLRDNALSLDLSEKNIDPMWHVYDSLIFPSGNRMYIAGYIDRYRIENKIEYYTLYGKRLSSPDLYVPSGMTLNTRYDIHHGITLNSDFLKPNIRGEVSFIIKFDIKADERLSIVADEYESPIMVRFNRIIAGNFDIYPEPDETTPTSFRYISQDNIDKVLREGIILNGVSESKQRSFESLNFGLTLFIGALSTFLMTIIIDRLEKWGRRAKIKYRPR